MYIWKILQRYRKNIFQTSRISSICFTQKFLWKVGGRWPCGSNMANESSSQLWNYRHLVLLTHLKWVYILGRDSSEVLSETWCMKSEYQMADFRKEINVEKTGYLHALTRTLSFCLFALRGGNTWADSFVSLEPGQRIWVMWLK